MLIITDTKNDFENFLFLKVEVHWFYMILLFSVVSPRIFCSFRIEFFLSNKNIFIEVYNGSPFVFHYTFTILILLTSLNWTMKYLILHVCMFYLLHHLELAAIYFYALVKCTWCNRLLIKLLKAFSFNSSVFLICGPKENSKLCNLIENVYCIA